ncbi:hypothetical protein PLEOSDRAFT_1086066 [Pleurotus ostreatus PC15]|uniref:Uncharacterized protein n=1 Tax=Pleurotus ostreatus (strain PC15) TaxID=1137138 RepID=A0A067N996_PLEO1|nr:hypothetical protein PLEOSDRAFT_1086066 [Pleurotus ostreatus PC15]
MDYWRARDRFIKLGVPSPCTAEAVGLHRGIIASVTQFYLAYPGSCELYPPDSVALSKSLCIVSTPRSFPMFDHEQSTKELRSFAKFGGLRPSPIAVLLKLGKPWVATGKWISTVSTTSDDMAESLAALRKKHREPPEDFGKAHRELAKSWRYVEPSPFYPEYLEVDTALDDADEEVVLAHRQRVGTKEDWAYDGTRQDLDTKYFVCPSHAIFRISERISNDRRVSAKAMVTV